MFPIVFFCAYGREKIEAWHLKKKKKPNLKTAFASVSFYREAV